MGFNPAFLKIKKAKKRSNFEILVANRLRQRQLNILVKEEYIFCPGRRWRFDFAFPKYKIAIECEGGSWIQGRHNRGLGFQNDCIKYNTAVLLGWRVLRYTPHLIDNIIPELQTILKS